MCFELKAIVPKETSSSLDTNEEPSQCDKLIEADKSSESNQLIESNESNESIQTTKSAELAANVQSTLVIDPDESIPSIIFSFIALQLGPIFQRMLVAVVDFVQDIVKNPTSNSCIKFIRKSVHYLTPHTNTTTTTTTTKTTLNTRESADISTQTNFLNHIQLDLKNKAKPIDTDKSDKENDKIETTYKSVLIHSRPNTIVPLASAAAHRPDASQQQPFSIPSNFKYSTEPTNESAASANGSVRSLPAFLEEIKMRQTKPSSKSITIESKVKSPSPPKSLNEKTPLNLLIFCYIKKLMNFLLKLFTSFILIQYLKASGNKKPQTKVTISSNTSTSIKAQLAKNPFIITVAVSPARKASQVTISCQRDGAKK